MSLTKPVACGDFPHAGFRIPNKEAFCCRGKRRLDKTLAPRLAAYVESEKSRAISPRREDDNRLRVVSFHVALVAELSLPRKQL